ncbi:uncharacterized protein LOC144329318 [Podarcis muralis]
MCPGLTSGRKVVPKQDGSGFAKWHRENVNNLAASLEMTNRRTYWPLPSAFSVQNSPGPRGSICGIKNFLYGMPPRKGGRTAGRRAERGNTCTSTTGHLHLPHLQQNTSLPYQSLQPLPCCNCLMI